MVSTIIEYDEELKKDKILRNIYDEYSDINVKDKKDENGLYTDEALNLIDKKLINETKILIIYKIYLYFYFINFVIES